ncbi:hypothetical protein LF887_04560 [Chryseobacterium sp. MEBOG06]|uniref:hypothetical protein n=1 Tax=Chryseobacterium sp. MEBOG06 TaxID=2879938 RepID=UPI001F39BF4F|nr:hypothetical protein [Chryseobacterium sp. MEBOG06]UKB84908.1 hypothetical protein LF887_04560 [Chryseobacterium sp. MEBOG06]
MKAKLFFLLLFISIKLWSQRSVILKYELDYQNDNKVYVDQDNEMIIKEISADIPYNIEIIKNRKSNYYGGSIKKTFNLVVASDYNTEVKDVVNTYEILYNENKGATDINGFTCKEYVILKNKEIYFRVLIDSENAINNTELLNFMTGIPFSQVIFPKGLIIGIKNEKGKMSFELKKIANINFKIRYDIENDIKKNNELERKKSQNFKSSGVYYTPPN